ncbi:MAG TPA: protein-L-isoaspartate(D-aspartate) O-methyltransferase [Gammaproteobacteria bacterium]
MFAVTRWLSWIAVGFSLSGMAFADDYASARHKLVETIRTDVEDTRRYLGRDRLAEPVLAAINTVPRHEFVPAEYRRHAYENRPLPIDHGQTISQPYIVAIMTDLLDLDSDQRVLEVGTGSGYQAAILAQLGHEVFSIEIIEALGKTARDRLQRLNVDRVQVSIGDGYYGWEQEAPFDAIIVTAAAGHIPPPLLKQLKPGGRMIIPVGSRFLTQQLLLITKSMSGDIRTRQILPVMFVPLMGEH